MSQKNVCLDEELTSNNIIDNNENIILCKTNNNDEKVLLKLNDNDNDNNDDNDNDTYNDNTIINSDTSTIIYNIANDYDVVLPLKKKRGRKSKKEIEMLNKIKEENLHNDEIIYGETKPTMKYKKRGRKPKGGKIIHNTLISNSDVIVKTNVILHLKCFLSDLDKNFIETKINPLEGLSLDNANNTLSYNIINTNSNSNANTLNNNLYNDQYNNLNNSSDYGNTEQNSPNKHDNECDKKINHKDILNKLKDLENSLRNNNINNKKSACFYCTGDFDNPPIYIPKHYINNSYHVYGCFCSPECATGYLMKEQIDSSIKYERYYLLNNIYSKIYNYEKSIKPAPDPYYTLNKFFGNLTIEEYRNLIKTNRLYILIDKPITRSLPELHEDNDDFIINNKIIPTSYQDTKNNKNTNFIF